MTTRADGRVPPHDLDAERAVLSAILCDSGALDQVADVLTPGSFYADAHGAIYEAALAVSAASQPVDLVTVGRWLKDHQRLQAIGGAAYLADVSDATPAIGHVERHAAIVRDLWRLREMISECHRIAAEGYGEVGDVGEWLDAVEARVFRQLTSSTTAGLVPMREVITRAFQRIDADSRRAGGIAGHPMGLRDLDRAMGGMCPGELIIIAARPGMGKSTLAQRAAIAVAEQGYGVAVFSMEMPEEQVGARFTFADAGVDGSRARQGRLDSSHWEALTASATRLAALPIAVDSSPYLGPSVIRSRVRRYVAQLRRHGIELGLVVVDYLQLMSGSEAGKGAPREQQIAHCSRALKALALELKVPVVALSQLNRGVESRQDKRPMMSDLRESGAIEQDADAVLLLYRHEYYDRDAPYVMQGVCEVDIAKARSGGTGTSYVHFDGPTTSFGDLSEDAREAYKRAANRGGDR
jgi:replicative DNA helicase